MESVDTFLGETWAVIFPRERNLRGRNRKNFYIYVGLCRDVVNPNGTNFVGANNELVRLCAPVVSVNDFACAEGINFKFSPAYSPHFGGIFEAGVKSSKYHLKRVSEKASLTFEELTTIFTNRNHIKLPPPIAVR